MRVAGALGEMSGALIRHQSIALRALKRYLVALLRALESGRFIFAALAAFSLLLTGAVRIPGKLETAVALTTVSLIQRLESRRRALKVQAEEAQPRRALAPQDHIDCEVLHDPGTERIRADVIFIHGLHGSLTKTWTQGVPDRRSLDGVRRHLLKTYSGKNSVDVNINNHHYRVSCLKRAAYEEAPDEADLLVCKCDDCATPDACDQEEEEEMSPCWPKDWLPLDCPGVRVIALGYTTDPYLWRPVWVPKNDRKNLVDRSREMTEKLLERGVGRRPIVWVAHSKGGLFVKQILVDDANERHHDIVANTLGILFYSVPHHGSTLATITIPWLVGQSVEITEVKKGCPEVRELHQKFLSLYAQGRLKADVVSLVESLTTPLYCTGLLVRVVDEETADPGVGELYSVSSNHKDICKPTSRKCILYQELADLINRVA